jgi:hypothetical protein
LFVKIRFSVSEERQHRGLGERSLDDGATWQLEAEFFARRVAA